MPRIEHQLATLERARMLRHDFVAGGQDDTIGKQLDRHRAPRILGRQRIDRVVDPHVRMLVRHRHHHAARLRQKGRQRPQAIPFASECIGRRAALRMRAARQVANETLGGIHVQRLQRVGMGQRPEAVVAHILHAAFDRTLLVPFRRRAEVDVKRKLAAPRLESPMLDPLASPQHLLYGQRRVIQDEPPRQPAEEAERFRQAVEQAFDPLDAVGFREVGVAIRQRRDEEAQLQLLAADHGPRLAKVDFERLARPMRAMHERFALRNAQLLAHLGDEFSHGPLADRHGE